MTGHRKSDDPTADRVPQPRSTDSESATRMPIPQADVVQDSPGTQDANPGIQGHLDEQGNYTNTSNDMVNDNKPTGDGQ